MPKGKTFFPVSRIKRGLNNAPCFQPPMKISRRGKEILAGSVHSVLEQVFNTIGQRSKINHEDALEAIGSVVFNQASQNEFRLAAVALKAEGEGGKMKKFIEQRLTSLREKVEEDQDGERGMGLDVTCHVCRNPQPPSEVLYSCGRGAHIICGGCLPQLTNCGICRASLTPTRANAIMSHRYGIFLREQLKEKEEELVKWEDLWQKLDRPGTPSPPAVAAPAPDVVFEQEVLVVE